ncbi:hypothetical protein [Vibrio sp. D431a]|uniref:hypothetical protein n=1 Tax=Vibrio sp. D431a TaxID=2837388 RepID=UPI0025537D66|nr:hypothetical protein [Vibrio sp. D431a]MDK9790051.1 hypothetical protein [Vibrio sp. D431a]
MIDLALLQDADCLCSVAEDITKDGDKVLEPFREEALRRDLNEKLGNIGLTIDQCLNVKSFVSACRHNLETLKAELLKQRLESFDFNSLLIKASNKKQKEPYTRLGQALIIELPIDIQAFMPPNVSSTVFHMSCDDKAVQLLSKTLKQS